LGNNQAIKSDIFSIFSSAKQSFPEHDITISHRRGGAILALLSARGRGLAAQIGYSLLYFTRSPEPTTDSRC